MCSSDLDLRHLVEAVARRHQLVLLRRVDAVEAGIGGRRAGDAHVDRGRAGGADHLDDLDRGGAAHDGMIDLCAAQFAGEVKGRSVVARRGIGWSG